MFAETCTGTCYNDYVIGSPANYDNAYFEVQHVRIYGSSSSVVTSTSGAPARAFSNLAATLGGAAAAAAYMLHALL